MPRLLRSMVRTPFHHLSGVTILLLFVLPHPANAVPYTFTIIDEGVHPDGTSFGIPTINDAGTVAFIGGDGSVVSLLTGSGGPLTTLASSGDRFTNIAVRPWINDQGEVAFRGALGNTGEGIFTVQDRGSPTTVATTIGPPFQGFGEPVVNSKGATAFLAVLDDGTLGIFISKAGSVTKLVDNSGNLALQGKYLYISMNDRGDVAFTSGIKSGGVGVFVSQGGAIKKLADTSERFTSLGFPSINERGEVAFWASLKSGGEALFVARGERLRRVADTRGPFNSFKRPFDIVQDVSGGNPVINSRGSIAFWASLDTGGGGIFSTCLRRVCKAGARSFDKVIGIGDPLFGHTVSFLDLLDGGGNDSGQIAFHAQGFTEINFESVAGIYRADPSPSSVPEPTTLLLLGTTAAGLGLARWRQRRRKQQS